MNNLIVVPLFILIFVGAFSQLWYFDEIDFASTPDNETITGTYNQTLGDNATIIEGQDITVDMSFDMTIGLTALIAVVVVLAVIGASVLGSKVFSEFGQKMVVNSAMWFGLWGIFSVFSYNALVSVPLFGVFFWFILTVIYTLGVFFKFGEG